MAFESSKPVTFLIEQLKSADEDQRSQAKDTLFREYSSKLVFLARERLTNTVIAKGHEPQAIVDTSIRSFLMDPDARIRNRNSLWYFLVRVIQRRCTDAFRQSSATKNGGGKGQNVGTDDIIADDVLGAGRPLRAPEAITRPCDQKLGTNIDELEYQDDDFFSDDVLELFTYGAQPEQAALVIDLVESLAPDLQQIAVWKLEGQSNQEIADRLKVVPRTIRRALNEIQETWS